MDAVTSIPHDYVIDSQGIIRGRNWREVGNTPKPWRKELIQIIS